MQASVLVTGGHGTMGPWVCRELARRGARAVVLDLLPAPRFELPGATPDAVVVGDVRDVELVRWTHEEHAIDRVIHLGALGPLPERYLHPVYEPVPVDLPPSPRQIYEVTKLAVERLVVAARARGMSAAAIRLSTTWGPGKSADTHAGLSFHSDLVTSAMRGGDISVDVHPDQAFDLIYYADIGAGLAAACLADGPLTSPVYHLGAGRLTRMSEFAAALEAAFPGCRIAMGDRLPAGRNVLLDIGPAAADLGYRPAYDVPAALDDMRRLVS